MLNSLRLVRQLQTAAAHPEVHGVHVDHARIGILLCRLKAGVPVYVEWNLNVDLLLTALTDGLGESKEPRVGTRCNFWNHLGLRALVDQS
jgi:hypothetical protein